MSYVLDALKKADAERERGSVPGLHAQPVPLSPDLAAPRSSRPWLWTVGGAVGAVVVCLVAWGLVGHEAAPPVVVAAAPGALVDSGAIPTTSVSETLFPATNVQSPRVAQSQQASTTAQPTPSPRSSDATMVAPAVRSNAARNGAGAAALARTPAAAPAPTAQDRDAPVSRRRPDAAASGQASTAPPSSAAASATSAAAANTRILSMAELPEDVKRGMPPLAVGGSIYSDTPSGRFVIINGQIFHEGDTLAADLVLEQIRLKMAILRYKGTRFSIAF